MLNIWDALGPFSNYAIYLAVALYFYVTRGCDVMETHNIALSTRSNFDSKVETPWFWYREYLVISKIKKRDNSAVIRVREILKPSLYSIVCAIF